jgi:hypothetical protein
MRIIVPHHRTRAEVIQTIDESLDQLLQQSLPVKLVVQQRTWQGSTLTFNVAAKMGFISSPVKGTIDVTDTDVTIDVDLGVFERFVPADKAQDLISTRIRGLLN